jgi:hypothetical protein
MNHVVISVWKAHLNKQLAEKDEIMVTFWLSMRCIYIYYLSPYTFVLRLGGASLCLMLFTVSPDHI